MCDMQEMKEEAAKEIIDTVLFANVLGVTVVTVAKMTVLRSTIIVF